LFSQLESKDPLIQLANTIDWAIFDNAFAKYYSKDNGAPSGVKEVLAAKIILPKKTLKRDHRNTLISSPTCPLSRFLDNLKSDFKYPIIGAMAARLLHSLR
jgi:hypothetical protein